MKLKYWLNYHYSRGSLVNVNNLWLGNGRVWIHCDEVMDFIAKHPKLKPITRELWMSTYPEEKVEISNPAKDWIDKDIIECTFNQGKYLYHDENITIIWEVNYGL